ncbi:MAG: hypothetical protein AAFZ80_01665 [Cyanobacteria bacterium P01_A01_bin.105]
MVQTSPEIMTAVEALDYRVTVADVAAKSGLALPLAQQGILALAADTQAHLQVAESGDVAYEFPRNFRAVLRNKYWQLRWQETWAKIWQVLFYLIRLSFGVVLLASIAIIFIAIFVLMMAASSQQGDRDDRGGYGRGPNFWISPSWFYWLDFGSTRRRRQQRSQQWSQGGSKSELNFFEAIFSFLFGDGDPNGDLEDRRWSAIATLIRNNKGTLTAEQVVPYLDDVNLKDDLEDFMLPVLSRFNGYPQVSPQGDLVYAFPELQVTAASYRPRSIPSYLREVRRRFSVASSDQLMLAAGLGGLNFVGAVILGSMLSGSQVATEFIVFVQSIYWFLWGYGAAFLGVPLGRYLWLQRQNGKIETRNQQRQALTRLVEAEDPTVQRKLSYAQTLATEVVLRKDEAIYTTETDLIDQDIQQKDRLDAEWRERLGTKDS